MKTRAELLKSKGYWIAKLQLDLYGSMKKYMEENKMNKTQLAEKLGVTKGYVTQILNGDFDHKISKLVELSLAIGKVPLINYCDTNQYIEDDELGLLCLPENERPNINLFLNYGTPYNLPKEERKDQSYNQAYDIGDINDVKSGTTNMNENCLTS